MALAEKDIIAQRLANQQLLRSTCKKAKDVVTKLGAVQAQEYAMAKWAIGLRAPGITDADIEAAFNKGTILRTHVLRPTWHFVAPEDIRWLLQLSAPAIHALSAYYYRRMELDKKLFAKSIKVLEKQLQGGRQATRNTIKQYWEEAGIKTDDLRMVLLLMYAELEGVLCSGGREGKQFTYTLLEERVRAAKAVNREEALHKLATLYFTTRGPATVQDFSWWSGLSITDAKAGVETLGKAFEKETFEKKGYIIKPIETPELRGAFLMPAYDEYAVSYKDRSALFSKDANSTKMNSAVLGPTIIVKGKAIGSWKKQETKTGIEVSVKYFTPPTKAAEQEVKKSIKNYKAFIEG